MTYRSDQSIGSIGQARLRSDKNFTDGEMSYECQGCKKRTWAGGYATIDRIHRTSCLRLDKDFTDGEITSFER